MDGNRNNPNIDKNAQTRQIPAQRPAHAAQNQQTRQIPVQKPAPAAQNQQTRQIPVQKPAPAAQNQQTHQMPVQKPAPAAQNSQTRQMPVQKPAPAAQNQQTRQVPVQKPAPAAQNPQTRQMPVQKPAPAAQNPDETMQVPVQRKAAPVPPPAKPPVSKVPAPQKSGDDMTKTRQVPNLTDTANGTAQDNTSTRIVDVTVEDAIPVKQKKPRKEKSADDERSGNTIISIVKAVVYIVAVLVVSVAASLFIILVGNDMFAFVKSDEVVNITVPEGADISDISNLLWENGVIEYPSMFEWYADHNEDDGNFVAGDYEVPCNKDYEDLLATFKKQVDKGTSWITIPEGYTTDEIINLMVESGIGTREGYVDVINNYPFDYWFVHELDEKNWKESGRYYRLDGYLFPDTYEFYNDSSEKTVIGKLLARFNIIYGKKYKEATEEMGMSADEIVIIASMIEKEAGMPSDYHLISSVFHNRLKSPYYPKMESDATALYAIHHETGERPTDVTGEHMQYDSPYNTYLYDGLPPGAIANPSASSINAALTPESTSYYYFVSYANTTLYGRNNSEHEYNKSQIRAMKDQAAGNTQE